MDLIAEIRERLQSHPELSVLEEEDTITVEAGSPEGFDVWCSVDENEYTVGLDGWHEHFEKSEVQEALNCFDFGLSDECRLKVISRGGQNHKWVMEAKEGGSWITYSTTALLWAKYWRKPIVKYLSNSVLKVGNA